MKDVTLGQILDLIDNNRESEEFVELMDNGEVQCRAMVRSVIWNTLEDKPVNSIQAEGNALRVWLD